MHSYPEGEDYEEIKARSIRAELAVNKAESGCIDYSKVARATCLQGFNAGLNVVQSAVIEGAVDFSARVVLNNHKIE